MRDRSGRRGDGIASIAAIAGAFILFWARGATAQEQPDAVANATSGEAGWHTDVYYENDTHVRGSDHTGKTQGLSKLRNTLQLETVRKFDGGWAVRGILRGTFDGVYDLNDRKFGNKAGSRSASDVQFENTAGPIAEAAGLGLPPLHFQPFVPFGGGVGYTVVDAIQAGAGLPNLGGPAGGPGINRLIDPNYANPSTPPAQYGSGAGLEVLGQHYHSQDGGVAFAVPVRPCDTDRRGCRDFGNYGDLTLNGLRFPEFNKRLDFLRELYVTNTFDLGANKQLFVRLGRQQVVWGRTDLFRVLDVINPVDYSRNNIYDELQDIRFPMLMLQSEYRMGPGSSMQDRNLQLVWNFDKFRPNNLGQCGTPNVILDAGCLFRGLANLWDSGGTVSNFAALSPPGVPGLGTGPWFATNFGPHQIGLRNVNLPGWTLRNSQVGLKFEGVTSGGLAFSLNGLYYRSQLPSLHAFNNGAVNLFTGAIGNQPPFSGPASGVPVTHLIAFDMYFPRVRLLGGSLDFTLDKLKASVRVEAAFTSGEEFANTARPELFSKNDVFRSVIGFDRQTFIPFINRSRTTLISAQVFYQHIFNHELIDGLYGKVGMPDWKDNIQATLLIKAYLMHDRLSPQLIIAEDVRARAAAISPQADWLFSDRLRLTFGANIKIGSTASWKFDDCRSCNPYPPYTTYAGQSLVPGSAGVGGFEPLGAFRAGPIGAAWKENEVYLGLRYKL